MICDTAREWIQQLLDDELDAARRQELERHLQGCVNCAEELHRARVLREKVRADAPYFGAPDGLARKVRSALRAEAKPRRQAGGWLWAWRGLAVAAALGVAVLMVDISPLRQGSVDNEVVSAHIRSLLPGHLIDVPSSDQHTVKPWFNGKLDFSPRVEDLKSKGFELKGGRLEYLHGRTVAALVFQRRQHVINLFVSPGADGGPSRTSWNGYNVNHWVDAGMSYWAVSDLNADELAELKKDYQAVQ